MALETPMPGGVTLGGFEPRVLIRHYFSTHLLWTAFHASDKARKIEAAHTGRSKMDFEHRAYVLSPSSQPRGFSRRRSTSSSRMPTTSTGSSAMVISPRSQPRPLRPMSATWTGTCEGSKPNALEKWQLMLIFAGREPLHRGGAPYQDAQLVMQLRNAILHFRPEHVAADEPHKMEERLRGKFVDNRLMEGSGNPWWPDIASATAALNGPLGRPWFSPIRSAVTSESSRTTSASPTRAGTANPPEAGRIRRTVWSPC
jgi:hypothetical protein